MGFLNVFRHKISSTTPKTKETIQSLWKLEKIILDSLDFHTVVQKISDSVLTELGYLDLGYRIIVLTLADKNRNVLNRVSLSQTPEAAKAQEASAIPFHKIDIPLDANDNLLIKTLNDKKPYVTKFWPDIFKPILTEQQALRNQAAAGIKTSMLFPVIVRDIAIGVLIFSMVKDEKDVTENEYDLIKGYTDVVGLAVQNAKLYTSLEETKKKLEFANTRLKELDKLKDDFVSVASHELRTPMTAIKSYLWVAMNKQSLRSSSTTAGLKKQDELSEDMKRYLSRAYISVERLINLVNDMLNISRIESGRIALKLSEVDLNDLTKEVVEEVSVKAQERGIRVIGLNKQIPKVLCDQDKIHEVFLNLIGNSLKFTPSGGKIEIRAKPTDQKVLVTVSDNGLGMTEEVRSNLFKVGKNVKSSLGTNKEEGSGLGLILCAEFVARNQGEIGVDSELGKGSQFWFTLPASAAPDQKQRLTALAKWAKLKILVAEDNELHKKTSAKVLGDIGCDVVFVNNGVKVLEEVNTNSFDLVLMDIDMPEMSGIEATTHLRQRGFASPIVALTAYNQRELARLAGEVTFDGLINKPLELDSLLQVLDHCFPTLKV